MTCSTSGCGFGSTPTSLLYPGTNGSAWNSGIGLYSIASLPAGVTSNIFADDGDPAYRSMLSQTINGLTVGDAYTLTFYQAAAQQSGLSGDTTEQWQVSFQGATQNSTLIQNVSKGSTPFTQQTMTFIANSTSSVLSFLALGTPSGEPPISLLAGVSMVDSGPTAVPEPATFALLAAGLIGLGVVTRRRSAA